MKAIVSFRIFYFESRPELVMSALQIPDASFWRRGERRPHSKHAYEENGWEYQVEGSDGETIAALVTKVIHSLLPRWSNFLEVVDRYEAELSCVIYLAGDERPEFTLQMN